MQPHSRAGSQFIAGTWVHSTSTDLVDVINPTTLEVIARVCNGSVADVDAAVGAARAAHPGWSSTPLATRLAILQLAADILDRSADEIAGVIMQEVGTTLEVARTAQVARPIQILRSLCDAAQEIQWVEQLDATLVVREAVPVVGCLTPWNFPLHQVIAKVGAALAAGSAVVLKPSELAPLSAYALADALTDAGLPAGVLNVVTGAGPKTGQALVAHPLVDQISFTGSTEVGRQVGASAAQTVKRVSLELGGKGPSVVLPGADVAAAAIATAARCFTNAGQVCAALSRLLVPRSDLAAAEAALTEWAASQKLGPPESPDTTMGPVISAHHRQRIHDLMAEAVAEGARLVTGGPDAAVPQIGHFVAPTVFSDVTSEMTIAQTEVFGPVLCVMAYEDVEDAIQIANDTPYGLVGAVFGPDSVQAARVAAKIDAGMIGINGARVNVRAPFGGYKQSGNGREFGTYGVEEFLEVKTVNYLSADEAVWPLA